MSWLGALAGGVENLLDRVDQVAGEALKDVDEPSVVEHSSTSVGGFHVPQDWPTTTRPTAIVAASAYSSFRHVSQTSPPPSSTTMHRVPVCKHSHHSHVQTEGVDRYPYVGWCGSGPCFVGQIWSAELVSWLASVFEKNPRWILSCSSKSWVVTLGVFVVVEYQTRNREVAGSTHTRFTASNLEQVANLLVLRPTQPSTLTGTGNE